MDNPFLLSEQASYPYALCGTGIPTLTLALSLSLLSHTNPNHRSRTTKAHLCLTKVSISNSSVLL